MHKIGVNHARFHPKKQLRSLFHALLPARQHYGNCTHSNGLGSSGAIGRLSLV
jgi:hypothetical protein